VVVLLTRVDIENFRSIYKASVPLSPFTLLVGENGSGKSNFLKLLKMLSNKTDGAFPPLGEEAMRFRPHTFFLKEKHYLHLADPQKFEVFRGEEKLLVYDMKEGITTVGRPIELLDVKIFTFNPQISGDEESLEESPSIAEDGQGVVRVLDALKTGDREDLFEKIEAMLKSYIPEIEKLSFVPGSATKSLQVREKYMPNPILVRDLSTGAQLILLLITLFYQEKSPSLICIENLDQGLHPRLFQRVVELCFELSSRKDGVQIIATTHNPYLVDEFKDYESAVLIVEKQNGETRFTPFSERLENFGSEKKPLGELWYSGFVGGVPQHV
jgi:predicted ATPase